MSSSMIKNDHHLSSNRTDYLRQKNVRKFSPPKGHFVTVSCSSSVESVMSRLRDAERSQDWASTLEVMTEAKVLKMDLPQTAIESAMRTYCFSGQQWARGSTLFDSILKKGVKPDESTVTCLFEALAQGRQGRKALDYLKILASMHYEEAFLSTLNDLVIRALVLEGEMEAALQLLEEAARSCDSKGRSVKGSSFTFVANELIKAGRQEQAEEVLEMRDYL
ncbi:hypothetical protein CEUSTIGMA_g9843.t1 [Chlamydomonas eustigma]|uniref:Pentacotripeptide-repeat region of PRORP domain-containing protein n=1 Tax=Chlamydomonas eustigma TaxID=1157962 RepID=A0A250XH57_9CHLO|nr:hypothetical protein CEUSTIGMA_g9843.t1 [Chlamydomonas eustigma]|eukprot:GAX82415.1 hypothetical protein CEUSTIGMA_g9843.t1 [Chlamydomonas eustigma]